MATQRPLSERLSKLPPGRHLIPSDYVSQNQRERILLATAELVAERGYQKTTIELIASAGPTTAVGDLGKMNGSFRSIPLISATWAL